MAAGSTDPWNVMDPWKTEVQPQWDASTWNNVTGGVGSRQLDTQQIAEPASSPQYRRTPYGVLLPPPFNTFQAKAQARADKVIKPQWKKSELFIKFGLAPEMVRTPRCNRHTHKRPKDHRRDMRCYPKLWREVKQPAGEWRDLKQQVDAVGGTGKVAMPAKLKMNAKRCFETWLDERCMKDMRVVENVTINHQTLADTMIIPGLKWCDFDDCPTLPETLVEDTWDLYLTDFATDCYTPLAAYLDNKYVLKDDVLKMPEGIWLRYHGLNMYALSSILATNHAIPSDSSIASAETACGRGVYTSRYWSKARQYAIPHLLPGCEVLTKVIALFVIPGSSGEGGAAVWKKKKMAFWTQREMGRWVKGPKWILVPEDAEHDECWEDDTSEAVPFPALQKRISDGRVQGLGEQPWTSRNDTGDEDQSSVVHLAGFFVTHCSASSARRMTCPSREGMYFAGWDTMLEPHVGRPLESWDDVAPREGRQTEEEIRRQSDAAKMEHRRSARPVEGVFGSGSSISESPREEGTTKPNTQVPTYQDVGREDALGSLKKMPGSPMWMVQRKDTACAWCLLCAKRADDGHMEGKRHLNKIGDPLWTLRDMGYPFLEWLVTNATTAAPATKAGSSPACSEPEQEGTATVSEDGTFESKTLGLLQLISGKPAWRVFRQNASSDWCLLCDEAASGGNGHIESKVHLTREACPKYWLRKNGYGFLSSRDDLRDPAASVGKNTTVSSGSSACAAAKTPWVPNLFEQGMAETRGLRESIYALSTQCVRIEITRADMTDNAVWLAVGRPGYLVFKEDSGGLIMDWMEPFCLLCKSFASYDHLSASKHTDRVKEAVYWVSSRGYEEVVEWIEKNSREVIEVPRISAAKKEVQAISDSESDGGSEGQVFRDRASAALVHWPFSVLDRPFADWPFGLLEVDLSTKKTKDSWGKMDPEMAEAIRCEAQKGKTQFEITLMVKKTAWKYEIDFKAWTQTNLVSGTVRKIRFGEV